MKITNLIKTTVIEVIFAVIFIMVSSYFFYQRNLPPFNLNTYFNQTNGQKEITHSLLPVLSNQWYSSVFYSFPSQPLYALPLAFKLTEKGLGIAYPEVEHTDSVISAVYSEEFSVGLDKPFTKQTINAVGDWTIKTTLSTPDGQTMNFVLGHGLPFTVLNFKGDSARISFTKDFTLIDPNLNKIIFNPKMGSMIFSSDAVIAYTNNHYFAFILPDKTDWSFNKTYLTLKNPNRIFIGLLDNKNHFNLFKSIQNIEVFDSNVNFNIDNSTLTTQYFLQTNSVAPLLVLYPHQFDHLSTKQEVLGEYESIRGPLKLVKAQSFTTTQPIIIPSGTYPKLSRDQSQLSEQVKEDIASVVDNGPPKDSDYYLGTWFGKVSNLLLLSDNQDLNKQRENLLNFVKPLFAASLDNFEYDKGKKSLIAKNSEFGNDQLNDHHFHYGYYIKTAAILANYDISIVPKVKDKIDQMVADIASTQREGENYPFLRNFDIYEGHSWADGFANTTTGNNQESSSEAINAWYAVYLWSKVISDKNLERYALYLYNTEILSADYYWFDIKNIYNLPYKHSIASIVWGGKVDFHTWFSDQTNMKYGIQLLPFTPASEYLGKLNNFQKYDEDYHKSGGRENDDWGDLFVMWKSFYYPVQMFKYIDKIDKFQTDNSKSLFMYTLYYNLETKSSDSR